MSLAVNADVDVNDLLVEHNSDGTHFKVKNLKWGLDASKPASPTAGDCYAATDTQKFYICYSAGTWVTATDDRLVKISSNDTVAGYLNGKAVAGDGIALTELNDGANESLSFAQHPDWRPMVCDGRLTLTSGTPVTTSDVTGATSLYYALYIGNRISLFDGTTNWKLYKFTERSLSLSGLPKLQLYDIFLYDNAGTLTLDNTAWKTVAATNSPTAGANKVINVPDTAGVVVGDIVTVRDGTNAETARVNTVVASTSITVDNLANGYTTPTIGYNSRATALTIQDGVWVKSGATGRRYLGTIMTTSAGAACEDSLAKRYVYNARNRVTRRIYKARSGNWPYANPNGVVRFANGDNTYRVEAVIGLQEDCTSLGMYCYTAVPAASAQVYFGFDLLGTAGYAGADSVAGQANGILVATLDAPLPIGLHFLHGLETGGSSGATYTFYDPRIVGTILG